MKALWNYCIVFLIVQTTLLFFATKVNCTWGLKIGGNYSYLKEPSYGKPSVSYLYGIGKDWKLYRWVQLGTELLISNSSTQLKNRSVQTSYYNENFPRLPNKSTTITYVNIDLKTRYLEFPILFKVDKSLQKDLIIGLEVGCSIKFLLKDASETIVLKSVYTSDLTEEERQNFRFDYRFTNNSENYSYRGRGLCPIVGMYADYLKCRIGLRYQVDYIDWVSSIVIGEDIPLHIIILSIGYQF
jgi:hypothetical protein